MNIVDLAILKKMVAGDGGVSSVNVTGVSGSHIESSGGPITDSGTIELNISTGYSIPSDDKQTAWDGKAVDIALSIDSSTYVVTAQLKDAGGALIGTAKTIDLPLESVVVSGTYDDQTKKVILTLQNGSTIEFSVADLVSGLQTELNDTDNKLNPDYIAYDASHRAVSDTEKDTWNAKQNAISDLETIRSGAAAGATAVQPATMSEALAAKQNSLNTAQLAAVNSGIDSDDVAQISTNQTNILYTLGKTGKNLINIADVTTTEEGFVIDSTGINLLPAGSYVFSYTSNQEYAGGAQFKAYNGVTELANPTITSTSGRNVIPFTIASTADTISLYSLRAGTYSDFMLCTQADYDVSPDYQPYQGLPNSDLTALETEDRKNILYNLNNGVKNTLNLDPTVLKSYTNSGTWSGNTYTARNKSFVANGDTVTVTGNAESNGARMNIFVGDIPANTVISGCPAGGATSGVNSYCIAIEDSNGTFVAADTGNSVTIATALTNASIYIGHGTGAVSSPLVFKPMVCTLDAWNQSHEHQPYALPNYDLTRLESEDRAGLVECVDGGAKNILAPTDLVPYGDGLTNNPNLTCTNNGDGTYTLNGSTVGNGRIIIHHAITSAVYGGKMLSGCPNINTGSEKCRLSIYTDTGASGVCHDAGQGNEIPTSFNPAHLAIYVFSGNTFNNVKFYPMICTKAAFGVSQKFVPFGNDPFLTVPINHNMVYRGQNLGATLTDAQHTALSSGNFTDLYLGDYWTKSVTIPAFYEVTASEPSDWSTNYTSYYTKSGNTYTPVSGTTAPTWAANTYYERLVPAQTVTLKAAIADFDTFYAGYASSYAGINTHHAAVIVHGFNNVVWNKTNTTAGGYVASLIHKWLVGSALPQIETWFGSAKVLSHQKLLTNAITGDAASGWAWSSQKISLLSENQMYGSKVWGNSKASNGGYEPGEAFKHLNVFNHIDANLLFGDKNIWLRDIASAEGAADLSHGGDAGIRDASLTLIAPAALILLS